MKRSALAFASFLATAWLALALESWPALIVLFLIAGGILIGIGESSR